VLFRSLEIPLKTKKPTTWFLNSMSDLFHESVTDEQIAKIWDVMAATPHHTYQILTKRPGRMLTTLSRFAKHLDSWAITHNGDRPIPRGNGIIVGDAQAWPLPNVWLGVTVENQKAADERQAPLKALADKGWFTWVSHEPALEQVDFTGWEFIRWLVMGGESGPGARPFDIEWPRDVMAWASDNHVDFFLKQLGSKCYGLNHGYTGKGTNPDEWPEALRVRQMPSVEVKP
jgi:protein gp37